ncbi:MAG: endonuclease domain-containing protein [Firmicutes bacterium]|nr:endonuclease domain-containing protein [Bacillota bacterium]
MDEKTPQFHTNLHYYKSSFQNARKLRKEMTEQERKLWYRFLRNYHVRFYRQRAIDNYIADFYCTEAKLIVEIDGSQHYSDEGEKCDLIRTKYFEALAIKVIRFTNPQVDFRFEEVCMAIDAEVKNRMAD